MTRALGPATSIYGQPNVFTAGDGTELASNQFDQWAYKRSIQLDFIASGRPVEDAFIESLNGKLRDECLNMHCFESRSEARRLIERWQVEYNETRPHSSFGNRAPAAYVTKLLGVGTSP